MRRIADFASLYQVRTGSHGPSDLSPVCHAAALHFDLWVPNFGVQEYGLFGADAGGLPAQLALR
jgi:mannonate dehydratase